MSERRLSRRKLHARIEAAIQSEAYWSQAFLTRQITTSRRKHRPMDQLCYSFHLLQAAILHGYRCFTDEVRSAARLWRSVLATLLYVGLMTFFAINALLA